MSKNSKVVADGQATETEKKVRRDRSGHIELVVHLDKIEKAHEALQYVEVNKQRCVLRTRGCGGL